MALAAQGTEEQYSAPGKSLLAKSTITARILKEECIRPGTPLSLEDARRIVAKFVEHYNTVRLHSAIGYVTPKDKLEGRDKDILEARDRKLEAARERRKAKRQAARQAAVDGQPTTCTT